MKDIKTKNSHMSQETSVNHNIVSAQMKKAYTQTKETAENRNSDNREFDTPEEYATDHVAGSTESTAVCVGDKVVDTGKKTIRKVHEYRKTRKKYKQTRDDIRQQRQSNHAPQQDQPSSTAGSQAPKRSSVKVVEQPPKTVKQAPAKTIKTSQRMTKGSVKAVQNSVKTAEKTAKATKETTKAAIKTTQEVAKAAEKTAQATAKAAKVAAQGAKVAAKAVVAAAKAVGKAIVAAVKAIVAAVKGLVAAIAAGGWVAVLIIVIICVVALIVVCCFTIFAPNDDNDSGPTTAQVVAEINEIYLARIEEIKSSNTYDILEISGYHVMWKDVLAVYAVKVSTDVEADKVVTMTDRKRSILSDIFWDMNSVSSRTESKTETVVETSVYANGTIIETMKEVTRVYLYIDIVHYTALQMADKYNFNADQREQLAELFKPEYDSLWANILYGIQSDNSDIIRVAESQLGNYGGEVYWRWYGFDTRVEWCACFVSWCANECGYIEAGIIPKFAACNSQGVEWFKKHGQWYDNSYIPNPGDIVFFDWDKSGNADHVGIVQKTNNGRIYVIEGNSSNNVNRNSYPVGSASIFGYGVPLL